jgi:aminoglycoside/choline kinase family phosphotransferase
LRKLFRGRYSFSKIISREFGDYPLLWVQGVVEQVLKAAVELCARMSGLNYYILRHRARPINDMERREWEKVWQMINSPTYAYPMAGTGEV